MLISLTVGKVDAGVAVLLTEDKRLIEFPSILLPPSIISGSIVDITVARNTTSEVAAAQRFSALQSVILSTYGFASPSPPILRCRNATQTSVVLEWDKIDLATAELRSLSLWRNGAKAGVIPREGGVTATKVSGLAVDTEYVFHLVLRTSAGVYSSEKLRVKTHKMTDLSGITVTPGILPGQLRESLSGAVERIGGKIADEVRIDTTHFVCTEGRGREWEKAVEGNIPVVRPEWVEGCEREGRIVGVRGYYLDANPKLRQVGQGVGMQQMQQQPQRPVVQQRSESQRIVPVREEGPGTPGTPRIAVQPPPPESTLGAENPEREPRGSVGGPPPPLPEKDGAKGKKEAKEAEEDEEDEEAPAGGEKEIGVVPVQRNAEETEKEADGLETVDEKEKDGSQTPGEFDEVEI
ncbi:Chitin synthase, class 5 [Puttea exsequens]|nr:Chitin synthase, class 5 [Puttea exsequens]